MINVYHNGACSKSNGALELLQAKGIPHEVRWYLMEPLSVEELSALLIKLGMQPSQLVRKGEPIYKERYEGKSVTENEWLQILADNPTLIERPIIENGGQAIIARPPERVLEMT